MMVARRRCISRDSSGFTAAVWPVHGRSRYRRMMELRLMLQIMSPFVADFVAKVGYGGWMPVSHSTIDDRL